MALKSPTQPSMLARTPDEPLARPEHAPRHNPVFQFIRECRTELRKVVWPTRQDALRMSAVVIVVSVATGLILGGFDAAITQAFSLVH